MAPKASGSKGSKPFTAFAGQGNRPFKPPAKKLASAAPPVAGPSKRRSKAAQVIDLAGSDDEDDRGKSAEESYFETAARVTREGKQRKVRQPSVSSSDDAVPVSRKSKGKQRAAAVEEPEPARKKMAKPRPLAKDPDKTPNAKLHLRTPPRKRRSSDAELNDPTSSPDPLDAFSSQPSEPAPPPVKKVRYRPKPKAGPRAAPSSQDSASRRHTPSSSLEVVPSAIASVSKPAKPVDLNAPTPKAQPKSRPENELARMMRKYEPIGPERAPQTAEEMERRARWREIAEQPTQYVADRFLEFGPSNDSRPACPFCDEHLPLEPSDKLLDAIAEIKRRPDAERDFDSANPDAYFVPFGVADDVCRMHHDESHTIPEGLERGWPAAEAIRWSKMPRRLRKEAGPRIEELIEDPSISSFYAEALTWYADSRGMPGVLAGFGSFEVEIPGYYGLRGLDVMTTFVNSEYVDSDLLTFAITKPLSVVDFMRRVLIPEIGVTLIMVDLQLSREEAIVELEASRSYGLAVNGEVD